MKYDQINSQLFIENRNRFKKELKPNSIGIFFSNDEHPGNGDATHHFKQNSDLFWLSGVDQEESILVISPNCPVPEMREALFIKKTNEQMVIWNGHKLTLEEAKAVSGIQHVYWIEDYAAKIHSTINRVNDPLVFRRFQQLAYFLAYNSMLWIMCLDDFNDFVLA
jgi:Xaa-Pro aminopeptidase